MISDNPNGHFHAASGMSGGSSDGYDANGNMTTRTINGVTYTLTYDAENRKNKSQHETYMVSLSSYADTHGAICFVSYVGGSINATFVYDADGKRVKGTVSGTTTIYVGSHYEVEGSATRKYYFAGAQRIAVRVNTTLSYLLADHLGSTSITVSATGTMTAMLRYGAWGETRAEIPPGATTPTNARYTGQYEEFDLKIYYYGARWYDPALSRWLAPDSIVPDPYNPLDWDRYSYVRNNSINATDPSGHIGCADILGSIGHDREIRESCHIYSEATLDEIKSKIEEEFGIEMKEDGVKWSINNLRTAYTALNMINTKLNGHLKSLVGGTTFTLSGGGNQYWGWTTYPGVTYHVFNGNTKIPLINFLHETGHLIDNADAFSGTLKGTTPEWVDSTGFVDENLLLGTINQPVQSKYIMKDGKQTEAFHSDEYWADAFANYVAGNINLTEPTGNGRIMYDYVYGALNPWANP